MTVTYLSENASGQPAGQSDAQAWANMSNQNGIVAYGTYEDMWYPFGVDTGGGSYSIALPGTIFIGPNMKIAKMGDPEPWEIELVLSSLE